MDTKPSVAPLDEKTLVCPVEDVYSSRGQGRWAGFVASRDLQHFLSQISKHMSSAVQKILMRLFLPEGETTTGRRGQVKGQRKIKINVQLWPEQWPRI